MNSANPRKVILYISMSLDGYLATHDDDLSWLFAIERPGEDYGYADFTRQVDTYLVGRRTYDVIRGLMNGNFPQARQFDCYVLTRQQDLPDADGVTFYNGPVRALVERLKGEDGGHIYCDGGAEIVRLLMAEDLIDEYIISVVPILLGDGKRLFIGGTPPINLQAQSCVRYDSGLIQLRYTR
ncbi:dihydrofolate reductase [Lewinella marina]|uniref:Dihydrofolate reductase n=1 Tax=Neolewinella marina TaxID=438751 RepID=A0A2G0CBK7_9BACT|nr:dihydrofolate reductase family protein [Neolewinella marina]NJB87131.1 dihydrofolate reductase [Neolewinella marina]PHK97342.1 dihydrofolate reductase [Neolewinella marina]